MWSHVRWRWLLSRYDGRIEKLPWRPRGPQILKRVLSGLLQKKSAGPWEGGKGRGTGSI